MGTLKGALDRQVLGSVGTLRGALDRQVLGSVGTLTGFDLDRLIHFEHRNTSRRGEDF